MNNSKANYPCINQCYIQGPTGPTGPMGSTGPANSTITVNSTITGEPGTYARVTNSGTVNNVLLDFVIPRGNTGPSPIFQVGTVTTGMPGTQASVTIRPIE